MELALDDDRELLRSTLKDFAKNRLRRKTRDWDEAAAIPQEALDEGWSLGLFADAESAPSALTGAVALEELAWGDLAFAQRLFAPAHVAVPVALFGTSEEKSEIFAPIAASAKLPAATGAWIEPSRGFDLASIRTRMVTSPVGTVVTGTKGFVPAGAASETTLVYARSSTSTGFSGIDAFVVSGKNASGVTRVAGEDVIGPRAAGQHRLAFEDAPARRIGGTRGVDYRILAARALTASAAAAVGVTRAAAEYAAAYAKERVAFGRAIAQNQSIAFMIADAFTDAEAARWMTWKAAWKLDRNEDALKEAGLAFRFATDAAFKHADNGVQILGGHGVIRDHLSELFFRNARALAVTPGALIV